MLGLILIFTGVGLLFMAISVPMINHRVKRNPWYGFRTPKTLSNDRIWYAANEHSGRMLFLTGILTIMAALLLAPIAFYSKDTYAAACTLFMVVALLYTTYLSFRFLRRL